MKKLSKIAFATLAGLAMIVSATSCVQIHANDSEVGDLTGFYVRGAMNNWGNGTGISTDREALEKECSFTKNDDGTYTYVFTAPAEEVEFAIADADWKEKFCDEELAVGAGKVTINLSTGGNAKITGLSKGSKYKMTVLALPTSVVVSVDLDGEIVEVDNSNAFADLYVRGGMNGWAKGEITKNDDGSYTFDFKATGEDLEFKVADNGYAVAYGKDSSDIAVGGDFVALKSKGENAKLTGMVIGNEYKLTLKIENNVVSVKLTLEKNNVPTFYIIGNGELTEMKYDGTSYCYRFKATGTSKDLYVYSDGSYYKADVALSAETDTEVKKSASKDKIGLSGLTNGKAYMVTLTVGKTSVKANVKEALCPYFMVGAINYADGKNVFTRMSSTEDDEVYEYEFTYATSMSAQWGSPENGVCFKITNGAGWDVVVFGDKTLTLDGDYVESAGGGNVTVAGLTNGKNYVFTLKYEGGKFYGKIAEKK